MPFQKKLLTSIGLGFLVFAVIFLWLNWSDVAETMRGFNWLLFPACLVLAFGNYLVRFTKWHYYVRLLDIPLPSRLSYSIFLSGLMMSATPGKFGEVFKSYLVKETVNTSISRSAPIVVAERLTDLIALVVMALLGIWLTESFRWVLWVALGAIVLGLAFISYRPLALATLGLLSRLPILNKRSEQLYTAYESLAVLIAPRPLLWATAISVVSWFFECAAFCLVMYGLGAPVDILLATFIYALATIVGALSMLPGGIGGLELCMVVLLTEVAGVPEGAAGAGTFIIRICTLWFAVGVGIVVLLLNRSRFGPVAEQLEREEA